MFVLTNDLRAQQGLPPLAADAILTAAAQEYARVLALNDWLSHDGPDGSTLPSRLEAAGYTGWRAVAENLYSGPIEDPPQGLVQALVDSPAHLSIMVNTEVMAIGVGCYVNADWRWCVQDFGAR